MIANETYTKLGLLQQCPQHDFSSNPVIITSCHTVTVYIVMEPWHHTVYDSASSWHKGSAITLTAILKTPVYNWLDVFINETETQTQKRVKAIKNLMSKFTNNNKCWHSKVTAKLSLKFKLMINHIAKLLHYILCTFDDVTVQYHTCITCTIILLISFIPGSVA